MENIYQIFCSEQILLHIPHSSIQIPEKYLNSFYLNEEQLNQELLRMTDWYTDELFDDPQIPEENRIVFPYSRLICDVERFRNDEEEVMAGRGMGVCYTATSSLKPLKKVTSPQKREVLQIYDRHHQKLSMAAKRVMKKYGTALLIDCHSFASERLPYETTGSLLRPDICIGTDPACHTPEWLSGFLEKAFSNLGYSVAVNEPFSGTMVPTNYYHREPAFLSVMIEVNRRLYINEKTGTKTEGFEQLKTDCEKIIWRLKEAEREV